MIGKSCVTNLLEVNNHISSVLDDGGQVDVVYLDMFQSYLSNRHQCVTVQGCTSTTLPVTSGVPQNSILGPVLFSLYVNDFPDGIKSSHVAMFADDTKLFKSIKSVQDNEKLQSDLRHLETWSEDSGLKFNETKCKTQCLTRKLTPVTYNYELNNKILIQTECEQDLGNFLDKNLTWKRQVNE